MTHRFRNIFTLALIGTSVAGSAAAAPPARLIAFHSGQCLNGSGKPGVQACGTAAPIATLPLPDGRRVMLRNEATQQCLFSNRDRRFGWYACTPGYADQHWEVIAPDAAAGPEVRGALLPQVMLRAAHSGLCLFSNQDGRFGVYNCTQGFSDQFWAFDPGPTGLQAFHSGKCLRPGGGDAACSPATDLDLLPLPQGGAQLRQRGANNCIYSNGDGRFAWYQCNAAWNDQHWYGSLPDASPGEVRPSGTRFRMLRSANSGKCLFSNRDGRFGVYTCTPAFVDQFWQTTAGNATPSWLPAPKPAQ